MNVNVSIGGTLIGEKNANAADAAREPGARRRCAPRRPKAATASTSSTRTRKDKADEEKNKHWLKLIKDALQNNGFVLFYQPIISLHGAEGEFYEILLRMQGPKGEILPNFFMPVAEQYG